MIAASTAVCTEEPATLEAGGTGSPPAGGAHQPAVDALFTHIVEAFGVKVDDA